MIKVSWYKRSLEQRDNWLLLINNWRTRIESQAKRTKLSRLRSSMETRISSGRLDWLRRLAYRRSNLRSKTRSCDPESKPTSRTATFSELKLQTQSQAETDLTSPQVSQTQTPASENDERKFERNLNATLILWTDRMRGGGFMGNANPPPPKSWLLFLLMNYD